MKKNKARWWTLVGIFALSATGSALADWVSTDRQNTTTYFFTASPPRIDRYYSKEVWQSAIPLPPERGAISAGVVADNAIYVAYDRSVYRHDLNGENEQFLISVTSPVIALHVDGDVLFINHTASSYARFVSIDRNTGAVIDTFENYVDSVFGSAIAPNLNKIFGRRLHGSPTDITYVSYGNDGRFIEGGDSPHHGAYPSANRVWLFPDEARVVDSSGTIYETGGHILIDDILECLDKMSNVKMRRRGHDFVLHKHCSACGLQASFFLCPGTLPGVALLLCA